MDDELDPFDELYDDEDEFEAYCVSCRQKTPIEAPQAIWTRRGAPGIRGTCAFCGTTVIRMGRTPLHARLKRPDPAQFADLVSGRGGRRIAAPAVYVNYSVADAEFAEILAEDLTRSGIPTWLPGPEDNLVQWATGVHPALTECRAMVLILTPLAIKASNVTEALDYFVKTRKPIVVALLEPTEIPDALRRKPRFDFTGDDYKQQLRQLVAALSE
ncbi:MAG: hypothetical protein Kow00106_01290 [Anaerolineae bacterium]